MSGTSISSEPPSHHGASWTERLDALVEARREQIIEVRRHLHRHPEPSGGELGTTLYLYQLLADQSLQPHMGPEGRGVVVDSIEATDGPRIALRADVDALFIHEQTGLPFASENVGLMHACGHDGHTAAMLGAILAIHDLQQEKSAPWPVAWRGVFQPAEETSSGARDMIEAGAIDGVGAILALHMDPSRATGRIGVRPGVLTASCDAARFVIVGRGGHAARPHEAVDPIAVAAQLISSIYLFVPRANDSQDAVVLTIGQILGGDNPNVIPEQVELRGTLRTLDRRVRERTMEHIRQLARGIAEASGSRIDVFFEQSVGPVVNDVEMTRLVRIAAADLLGAEQVDEIARPSMGSEDFASYLERMPGAMFRLGCASPELGCSALHTPTFNLDEQALLVGAKTLARAAVLWADPDRASLSLGARLVEKTWPFRRSVVG
jgi:amidohydrolase